MARIMQAQAVTEAFVSLYNAGDLDGLMELYEDEAVMRYGSGKRTLNGKGEIRAHFQRAMQNPARLVQRNNFCIEHDGLAMVRGDYGSIR